jgi:hypothetical protein
MSTPQQIEANRLNAQRSTGPRSAQGKAAVRFNALKSGIDAQAEVIPGEDPGKLETLLAEYQDRFDASTPERRMLVDTLVNCEWMLRRLRRGEAQFWKFKDERTFTKTDYPEGCVLDYGDKVYDRIQRRLNSILRNYHRALDELQDLEDAATAASEDTQSSEAPAPSPEPPAIDPPEAAPSQPNQPVDPQFGFVPQSFPEQAPRPAQIDAVRPVLPFRNPNRSFASEIREIGRR